MESSSTLPSKITAGLYGLVCIGVAFLGTSEIGSKEMAILFKHFLKLNVPLLAQYLGGILQISLSIFGSVGGPLLGMFTLGMFTLSGNQRVNFELIHFLLNRSMIFSNMFL